MVGTALGQHAINRNYNKLHHGIMKKKVQKQKVEKISNELMQIAVTEVVCMMVSLSLSAAGVVYRTTRRAVNNT
jgi:hypothetical protein